jgi:hypothetical protein
MMEANLVKPTIQRPKGFQPDFARSGRSFGLKAADADLVRSLEYRAFLSVTEIKPHKASVMHSFQGPLAACALLGDSLQNEAAPGASVGQRRAIDK